MHYLNIVSLFGTALICTIAIFSESFDDSLIQRLGLAIVAIATFSRAWNCLGAPESELIYIWKNIGIFLFAAGTAIKFTIRHFAINNIIDRAEFPYDRRVAK